MEPTEKDANSRAQTSTPAPILKGARAQDSCDAGITFDVPHLGVSTAVEGM